MGKDTILKIITFIFVLLANQGSFDYCKSKTTRNKFFIFLILFFIIIFLTLL